MEVAVVVAELRKIGADPAGVARLEKSWVGKRKADTESANVEILLARTPEKDAVRSSWNLPALHSTGADGGAGGFPSGTGLPQLWTFGGACDTSTRFAFGPNSSTAAYRCAPAWRTADPDLSAGGYAPGFGPEATPIGGGSGDPDPAVHAMFDKLGVAIGEALGGFKEQAVEVDATFGKIKELTGAINSSIDNVAGKDKRLDDMERSLRFLTGIKTADGDGLQEAFPEMYTAVMEMNDALKAKAPDAALIDSKFDRFLAAFAEANIAHREQLLGYVRSAAGAPAGAAAGAGGAGPAPVDAEKTYRLIADLNGRLVSYMRGDASFTGVVNAVKSTEERTVTTLEKLELLVRQFKDQNVLINALTQKLGAGSNAEVMAALSRLTEEVHAAGRTGAPAARSTDASAVAPIIAENEMLRGLIYQTNAEHIQVDALNELNEHLKATDPAGVITASGFAFPLSQKSELSMFDCLYVALSVFGENFSEPPSDLTYKDFFATVEERCGPQWEKLTNLLSSSAEMVQLKALDSSKIQLPENNIAIDSCVSEEVLRIITGGHPTLRTYVHLKCMSLLHEPGTDLVSYMHKFCSDPDVFSCADVHSSVFGSLHGELKAMHQRVRRSVRINEITVFQLVSAVSHLFRNKSMPSEADDPY